MKKTYTIYGIYLRHDNEVLEIKKRLEYMKSIKAEFTLIDKGKSLYHKITISGEETKLENALISMDDLITIYKNRLVIYGGGVQC